MTTMRAIVIEQGSLVLRDVPRPEPGPGQVRVRIRASAVNRADVIQRRGMYPAPPDAPADIPGLEIAGEIEALGSGFVGDIALGDRVFGIVGGGGYAEAVVVHARSVARIPEVKGKPLDWHAAAAIPEAFVTAYDAMVLQGGLAAGETVLIHAAGSGVGTAAAQIARAIGARAIGTFRSKGKVERAARLGLSDSVVVGGDATFAARVRALTGGRGVDVVLELVGGAYVPESLAALADRGRLVLVGLMAGASAELDLGSILRRRLRLFGTVLRSRPLEEKIAAAQVLERNIAPLVATGQYEPVIDKVFPLAEAMAAQDYMTSNASFGKIVLET